ncbi:MAG TPA: glutamate mutase L [Candidatus Nitrosotenuis sp.]|nr:glutamate mutase L [Candidatus Nitrosotenuis sp.]
MKRLRVGIDVGGTFTHAVAVDNDTLEVLAQAVTPTTHRAAEGVARGVLEAFSRLQAQLPARAQIVFLAHSTTQATNALLEGDVAEVGILGLGSGLEAFKARADMTLGPLELAPGKHLHSHLEFLDPRALEGPALAAQIESLRARGARALVAAQAFSVDDPAGEQRVLAQAAAMGMPACATHEMSGLYGLRVRTRTAVLNASILPKMMETADMTEASLRRLQVQAPLMIMRSDGGVMSLEEMRRRPVMTLLSGPAAGIAAALMFLRASDALFLEVGGTSTDICLIRDGRAASKSATVGGHPTYLKTLDSRTLGIAGGSLVRRDGAGIDVGPRSAHLAGWHYASFTDPAELEGPLTVREIPPLPGDPPYLVVETARGLQVGLTPTCAANLAGFIPEGDYSRGQARSIRRAMEAVAGHLGRAPEELAQEILERAAAKVVPTLHQLIEEYGMKDRVVKLLGGGGGASALVPFVAARMQAPFEIAPRAEVISAIGAALAMVRESLERNILHPGPEDLARLRAEAEKAVLRMGADPATVEVTLEVDSQRNIVRATATGAVEMAAQDARVQDAGEEERLKTLRENAPREESLRLVGRTEFLYVYEGQRTERTLFNLLKRRRRTLWVTDGRGNVKLQVPGGRFLTGRGEGLMSTLQEVLSRHTSYGDAGARIPPLHLVAGKRLVDLSALQSSDQVLTLARQELSGIAPDEPVLFLIHPEN